MSSLTDKGLIVICDSLAQALQTINVIAPEHLELHVSRPMELLGQIRNAGAIFMGEWTLKQWAIMWQGRTIRCQRAAPHATLPRFRSTNS